MTSNDKKYVERVLNDYQEKQTTKIDELKSLDKKAKTFPNVFAYVFGSISALVLGFGMCLAMEVILPGFMWLGIIIGVVGIALVTVNYFLYNVILAKNKAKYAEQIKDGKVGLFYNPSEKTIEFKEI